MDLSAFAEAQLSRTPARNLEVGRGDGELAFEAGPGRDDVTAIGFRHVGERAT
jgi:hypothetical protein